MDENPTDKAPKRPFRLFSDWFRRPAQATPAPLSPPPSTVAPPRARIGHYAITGKLGEGGMGIVYVARDERLRRDVALKTMSSLRGDEAARKRFWLEARAAASVNHPNVCQLYEIGEDDGELFIAMELLEGEALAARLTRGPLTVSETLPIGLGILAALSALHARGVIHRDLKPSNVFLTPHGVKLLDFGLARTTDSDLAQSFGSVTNLTRTGMVVGTPRYMAPEQVMGGAMDGRGDLFAAGAILFEMLAGRPAFEGKNVVEVLHATLHEQPPALTGSPAVAAVDRVIRRALSKKAPDRPESAEAMAEELRGVRGAFADETPALARALKRLVVLPFRILRSDPETDFLAFSLPDAIATSLTRFDSLIVRSNVAAARFDREAPDLKALAVEADVDRVVMGTVLRSGDQLRATAQLVEAPGGTLLTSHTVLSSLGDLFRLQDDIVQRVVAALSLPLGGGSPPTPAAPQDAHAYELYLRANEMGRAYNELPRARDLYKRCLELDPTFAPAWAQLARCHRVIGKFIDDSMDSVARAEEALRRALELNPRLSVAHKYYANLEADTGHAQSAMLRLLGEANRHGNDPELFAGLVHACRYCGLYEQSIAAHEEARRLDPNVPTSLEQTLQMTGDVERLLAVEHPAGVTGGDHVIRVLALGLAGRRDVARGMLLQMGLGPQIPAFKSWTDFMLAWLDRRPDAMKAILAAIDPVRITDDPEAKFQEGWLFCDVGEYEHGQELLRQAVANGYFAAYTLSNSPHFDAIRNGPAFQEILARAEEGRAQALAAYRDGGGERLLG